MSSRDDLGQLVIYRLAGVTHLTDEVARFLVECRAGGVCLFSRNFTSRVQVKQLISDLQALADRHGLPPFLISVDEEGGRVSRMPVEAQSLIMPSQMAQTQADSAVVRECARLTARNLRSLGFNMNFAPVLDVNNNPLNPVIGIRSFGDDPAKVAELSAVAIEAYIQAGVSPCVKHFPGHGDTAVDSHLGLPVVNKSLDELEAVELVPFRRAIEAGVPAIMTAHILYPLVGVQTAPATLSRFWLTEMLRQRMNYDGLVLTDALDMQAIAAQYSLGEASVGSLNAGADLLMVLGNGPGWLEEQRQAYQTVVAAAESGRLSMDNVLKSSRRLDQWRRRFAIAGAPEDLPVEPAAVVELARQCLVVDHADQRLLPVPAATFQRPQLIDFSVLAASAAEEIRQPGPMLEKLLKQALPGLRRLELPVEPTPAQAETARKLAAESDLLILVTRHAHRFQSQADLVTDLIEHSRCPVIGIAAANPYDLALLNRTSVAIATCGDPAPTIIALTELLTGQ